MRLTLSLSKGEPAMVRQAHREGVLTLSLSKVQPNHSLMKADARIVHRLALERSAERQGPTPASA